MPGVLHEVEVPPTRRLSSAAGQGNGPQNDRPASRPDGEMSDFHGREEFRQCPARASSGIKRTGDAKPGRVGGDHVAFDTLQDGNGQWQDGREAPKRVIQRNGR
jgi:hypothetical protein